MKIEFVKEQQKSNSVKIAKIQNIREKSTNNRLDACTCTGNC